MIDSSQENAAEFAPLPCNTIVYRAVRKNNWVNTDTDEVLSKAFFLRKNETGASVNISTVCSAQDCANKLNKCSIVLSLHIGKVRSLGLDIIQDKFDHANITGLPEEDDLAEAERIGGLLAKQSRVIRV